jgi:hypothetical protein
MSLEHAKSFLERALGRPHNINARIRQAGSFATQQCACSLFLEERSAFKSWTLATFPTAFFCYSQRVFLCTTHR